MYAKIARDRIISRTDRWISSNFGNKCTLYVSCTANELIRFGGHRALMYTYVNIACDHIIIRTDEQITIKPRTCINLAEPMN